MSSFSPPVHIHDGTVHPKADFDHTLYCQPHHDHHLCAWPHLAGVGWACQRIHAGGQDKGVIEADQHCYQRQLHGQLPNRDTILKIVDSYLSGFARSG